MEPHIYTHVKYSREPNYSTDSNATPTQESPHVFLISSLVGKLVYLNDCPKRKMNVEKENTLNTPH